jgi:LacI family transcriptional regulator
MGRQAAWQEEDQAMRTTLAQIAKAVNVSEATVSRVLSGKGRGFISEPTRAKVLEAASRLGYQPNRLARGLATGRTGLIALWIRNPNRPYYASILRCFQKLASQSGHELILGPFIDEDEDPAGPSTRAASWPIDGIIAVDCPEFVEPLLVEGKDRPVVVGVGNAVPPGCDSVTFELGAPFEQATRLLVEQGRQHIAHLTSRRTVPVVKAGRAGAYERVMRERGIAPVIIEAKDERRVSARDAVALALSVGAKIDAIIAVNDDMALGACKAVRDAGLSVPIDVAVIGCDDIEDAELADPALTTIRQPVQRLCAEAWGRLCARIEDRDAAEEHVTVPLEVVRRGSA